MPIFDPEKPPEAAPSANQQGLGAQGAQGGPMGPLWGPKGTQGAPLGAKGLRVKGLRG